MMMRKPMPQYETMAANNATVLRGAGILIGGVLKGAAQIYARLAAAAYKKAKSDPEIDGFQVQRQYGQANSSVYFNPERNEVVLSIRGTAPTNPEDLALDAHILAGSSLTGTTRFKQLEQRLKELVSAFPGARIILTGHSLGGSLARALLLKHHKLITMAHVYNMGSGLGELVSGLVSKFKNSNEARIQKAKLRIYQVPGDLISFISRLLPGKIVTERVEGGPLAKHSIDKLVTKDPINAPAAAPVEEPATQPTAQPTLAEAEPDVPTGGRLKRRGGAMLIPQHLNTENIPDQLIRAANRGIRDADTNYLNNDRNRRLLNTARDGPELLARLQRRRNQVSDALEEMRNHRGGIPMALYRQALYVTERLYTALDDVSEELISITGEDDNGEIAGAGLKQENPWIAHVRRYAKKHKIPYSEAVKLARKTYKKRAGN